MKKRTRRKNKSYSLLITAFLLLIIVAAFFLWREPSSERSSLIGEAKRFAYQTDTSAAGRCQCSFRVEHTRFFMSNLKQEEVVRLQQNQELEFFNDDAHSRVFNQIKSDVIRGTEAFELDKPQSLEGVFKIGNEPDAPVFEGICRQAGSYKPTLEDGACDKDNDCQQACPQIDGIGDLLVQLEADCAEFITRTFNGFIGNKLTQRGVYLHVMRDLDDVAINGKCEIPG